VIVGDTVLTRRLWDNATARDLIAQLPLTLTFRDFNGVEKIAQLPRKLSLDGVPAGADPLPRDIGYYAPSEPGTIPEIVLVPVKIKQVGSASPTAVWMRS
jgi:hypothetical protein